MNGRMMKPMIVALMTLAIAVVLWPVTKPSPPPPHYSETRARTSNRVPSTVAARNDRHVRPGANIKELFVSSRQELADVLSTAGMYPGAIRLVVAEGVLTSNEGLLLTANPKSVYLADIWVGKGSDGFTLEFTIEPGEVVSHEIILAENLQTAPKADIVGFEVQ